MRLTMLSGGVGGARLARGLAALDGVDLTVIVNVGDDDELYGLSVSPDLDTVTYTLAGIEGIPGWGLADDSHIVMNHLEDFGVDTRFKIGDGDLATNLYRTIRLRDGASLSQVTAEIAAVLDLPARVLPATDQSLRTEVLTASAEWRSFQDYFVIGRHEEEVVDLRFANAADAEPAPGVIEAIEQADAVVIGPSNPPLSIWPILAVPQITDRVSAASRVLAVSPLFGGRALKGPAHLVLASLGFPPGNEGVIAAYDGLLSDLIIDQSDAAERGRLTSHGVSVHVRNTRFPVANVAQEFGRWLIDLL
ncbi:MAG: 2-phospho-L-lactate transferase CofD family protein [Acidimicrobiia bacterium]